MSAGMRTVCAYDGTPLVNIYLPDSWTAEADMPLGMEAGYGEPQFFLVTCTSPDQLSRIYYLSAFHYRHDYLSHQTSGYDNYGNLHREFVTAEEFTNLAAEQDLFGKQEVRIIRELEWDSNRMQMELYKKQVDAYTGNDPYTVPGQIYCKGIQRIYSYKNNGVSRRRIYSLIIKAADFAYWMQIPPEFTFLLNDAAMGPGAKAFLANFPNARYDKSLNEWIYTYQYYKDWRVDQQIILDCAEEVFEKTYESVLRPLVSKCVFYTEELQQITRARQEKINAENRRRREEEERIRKEKQSEAERRRREEWERANKDRAARQQYSQTLRKVSDMRSLSDETWRKPQAKDAQEPE